MSHSIGGNASLGLEELSRNDIAVITCRRLALIHLLLVFLGRDNGVGLSVGALQADSLSPQEILQLVLLRGSECLHDSRQQSLVGVDKSKDGLVERLELVDPIDRSLELVDGGLDLNLAFEVFDHLVAFFGELGFLISRLGGAEGGLVIGSLRSTSVVVHSHVAASFLRLLLRFAHVEHVLGFLLLAVVRV